MSNSIIEALFNGCIIPCEHRNTYTPEHTALKEKIENEKRYFIEKMSIDDCSRFQQLENLFAQAAIDEEAGTYSHGFTLGALLMAEIMEKKETFFNA